MSRPWLASHGDCQLLQLRLSMSAPWPNPGEGRSPVPYSEALQPTYPPSFSGRDFKGKLCL